MLMMRPPPPCLIICLAAIWTPKKALLRLIVSTRSYCASVVSRIEVRVFGPRVVHHDVETAEFRHGGVDEPLQVVGAAGVGIDADRLIVEGRNLLLQLVGRLGVSDVVDDDADAGSGEPQRDRLADPLLPPVTIATFCCSDIGFPSWLGVGGARATTSRGISRGGTLGNAPQSQ